MSAAHPAWTYEVAECLKRCVARIERLQKALIEIEHHSTDKNAAATARAALAVANALPPQAPGEGDS